MHNKRLLPVVLTLIATSCAPVFSPAETEPAPTPTLPPAFVSAAIDVCRDAALALDLPPQATGTCVTDFEWYMRTATDGKWPGTGPTRTNSSMSEGFQAALNVVGTWQDEGLLGSVRAEDARNELMGIMQGKRQQLNADQ